MLSVVENNRTIPAIIKYVNYHVSTIIDNMPCNPFPLEQANYNNTFDEETSWHIYKKLSSWRQWWQSRGQSWSWSWWLCCQSRVGRWCQPCRITTHTRSLRLRGILSRLGEEEKIPLKVSEHPQQVWMHSCQISFSDSKAHIFLNFHWRSQSLVTIFDKVSKDPNLDLCLENLAHSLIINNKLRLKLCQAQV